MTKRVKLHELYREVEALGGAANTDFDHGYTKAIDEVTAILRAAGFGDGFYVDAIQYEARQRRAALAVAAE